LPGSLIFSMTSGTTSAADSISSTGDRMREADSNQYHLTALYQFDGAIDAIWDAIMRATTSGWLAT
jgi:hypothetical protein